jgi:Tol biopolymer transport system component
MRALGPLSDEGFPAVVGLFLMDADGSNLRQLTQLEPNSGTEDHFPTWSPDGRQIAFLRWNGTARPRNASAIYRVDPEGGEAPLLRRIPRRWPGGGSPDWSPDGRRILFTTYCYYRDCDAPATGAQLFTMNPDGGELRGLTHLRGNAYQGGWSPSGTKIVFTRNRRSGGVSDIYTMKANGSKLRRGRARRDRSFSPTIRTGAPAATDTSAFRAHGRGGHQGASSRGAPVQCELHSRRSATRVSLPRDGRRLRGQRRSRTTAEISRLRLKSNAA